MYKRIFVGTIIFLSLLALTLLLVGKRTFLQQPLDVDTVRAQITEVQTLLTTRYEYRDVIYFDEQTRLLGIPTGSKEILFSIRIDVIAGINLDDGLEVTRGPALKREIFVTLPHPQVIRVEAREDSIDQYFVRSGLQGIDWLDITDEVETAKERNREDAVKRGILGRAQTQGELIIQDLLRAAGYEQVHVRFRTKPDGEGLRG